MRIAIGSDHSGLGLKTFLKDQLESEGHAVRDFGTNQSDPVDYPDIAIPLAQAVAAHEADLGVVICSNGVGVSMAANKAPGVRAALCSDPWSAQRAREHTDCNVLALGAYAIGSHVAQAVLAAFLAGEFQGGRHARRVAKINALDAPRRPD
ncbi:MAG: ribose 5-phosphate isomerase B [Dehalococcoidia bacterium]